MGSDAKALPARSAACAARRGGISAYARTSVSVRRWPEPIGATSIASVSSSVELCAGRRKGALGDLGYRGERLAKTDEMLGIRVEAIARGRDGRFVPAGICGMLNGPSPGSATTGG
jgi:hypothetical protein